MKHQIEMNDLIQFKQLHVTGNEVTQTIHVGDAIEICGGIGNSKGGVRIISFEFPQGKWICFENIIDVVKS